MKRTANLHPFLFAIWPVVFIYSLNVEFIPFSQAWLAMLIVSGVATLLYLLLAAILRNWMKAGAVVSLFLMLFFSYTHVYVLLWEGVDGYAPSNESVVLLIVWALLFAGARRVPESERYLRAGKFKGWGPLLFLGGAVTGQTLGIIGAGRIGSAVAMKSRGFNMRILYTARSAKPQLEAETGARRVELEELLRESDFVSLHVPLSPDTVHLIHAGSLRLMKPTAYLINTGRGPLVDEAALADALKGGVIAGAALDVFEHEPAVHPELVKLENVVLTPHTASATVESRSKMAVMAAENLIAGLAGERPQNLVNPQVCR